MNASGLSVTTVLLALARGRGNNRCRAWYGHSGSGSRRRVYRCYVCREIVDTESATDRPTVHATRAIEAHARVHMAEVETSPTVRAEVERGVAALALTAIKAGRP